MGKAKAKRSPKTSGRVAQNDPAPDHGQVGDGGQLEQLVPNQQDVGEPQADPVLLSRHDMDEMGRALDAILARQSLALPVTTDDAEALFRILRRDMPGQPCAEVSVTGRAEPRGPARGTGLAIEVWWMETCQGLHRKLAAS